MNNSLTDIITNNFITGYRAIDCCRIKNKVVKIRSINNDKYDILPENFENVFYNELIINGKVIPYIYGNINSYIKFPNIIKSTKYTICTISKYNGNNKNKILTIQNPNNKISSLGHSNGWSGIIEFVNSSSTSYKQTTKNYNDNWVITCLSYNGDINDGFGYIYIGSDFNTNYDNVDYFNINNISPAIIGNLTINKSEIPQFNSDWALSHLLVWNVPLSSFDLKTVYNNMYNYLNNPSANDLIFYNQYPRNFPNCIEQFYNINTEMDNKTNPLSIKLPWAGYNANDYDSKNNILPNFIDINDRTKDIKTININNVKLNNKSSPIPFLYGDKDSYIIFPDNSINSNFTICSITKYTSKNPDNNKKILRSIDNKTQFYHGHFNNKIGVIQYDNHEFSKGIAITAENPADSWISVCAKNSKPPNNVYINNNDLSLTNVDTSYFSINRNPNILTINYNKDMNTTDNSEWALSYILIWDTHLTDEEIKSVSNALNIYIQKGIIPSFTTLPISKSKDTNKDTNKDINKDTNKDINKDTNKDINKYQFLNLTDIQKKMLL
jgi:hypothetical protein